MRRWLVAGTAVLALTLGGCASFSWKADKTIAGNNTGGIVPAAVRTQAEADEAARAHCAQYHLVARITATQAEAGGKTVFVCEKPGLAPPPNAPVASYPGQTPAYPGERPLKRN